MGKTKCDVEGCDRNARYGGRGPCQLHHRRVEKWGVTEYDTCHDLERFNASVQKSESGCWEWTASKTPHGYGYFQWDGSLGYAHRWSYFHWVGDLEPGLQVDHQCHNSSCVNPNHLVQTTRSGNQLNLRGPQKNNTPGFLGVVRNKKRFGAHVSRASGNVWLGTFDTPQEAGQVAKEKREELALLERGIVNAAS